MYFLLNMGDFPTSHVSELRGCNSRTILGVKKHPKKWLGLSHWAGCLIESPVNYDWTEQQWMVGKMSRFIYIYIKKTLHLQVCLVQVDIGLRQISFFLSLCLHWVTPFCQYTLTLNQLLYVQEWRGAKHLWIRIWGWLTLSEDGVHFNGKSQNN